MTDSHWALQENSEGDDVSFASTTTVWGREGSATTHSVVINVEVVDVAYIRTEELDVREVLGEHHRDDLLLAWEEIEANMAAFGLLDRLLVVKGLFIDPDAQWQPTEQEAVAGMLVTLGQTKSLDWIRGSALVVPMGNLMASTLWHYGLLPLDSGYTMFRRLAEPPLWAAANEALPAEDSIATSLSGDPPVATENVMASLQARVTDEWKRGAYEVTTSDGKVHNLRPLEETLALVRYYLLVGQDVTVAVARKADLGDET